MDANITKITTDLPLIIPSRQYFLETEVFNFKGGASKSVYHGGTYTGYLKVKNGGMKIIRGDKDNKINEERELIIDYLKDIIAKKEQLNVDDIPIDIFYKALEGKYIRNLMCSNDDEDICDAKINSVLSKAYKLTKIGIKTFIITNLDVFKQNAPQIYKHFKDAKDDLPYYSKLKTLVKKYNRKTQDTRELNSEGGAIYQDTVIPEFAVKRQLASPVRIKYDNDEDDDEVELSPPLQLMRPPPPPGRETPPNRSKAIFRTGQKSYYDPEDGDASRVRVELRPQRRPARPISPNSRLLTGHLGGEGDESTSPSDRLNRAQSMRRFKFDPAAAKRRSDIRPKENQGLYGSTPLHKKILKNIGEFNTIVAEYEHDFGVNPSTARLNYEYNVLREMLVDLENGQNDQEYNASTYTEEYILFSMLYKTFKPYWEATPGITCEKESDAATGCIPFDTFINRVAPTLWFAYQLAHDPEYTDLGRYRKLEKRHKGGYKYTNTKIGAYRGGNMNIDDESLKQLRIELGR
jgi:hypothetical protein